jgi:hypothetical protein
MARNSIRIATTRSWGAMPKAHLTGRATGSGTAQDGTTLYRLFHQGLADYLHRGRGGSSRALKCGSGHDAVDQAIVARLLSGEPAFRLRIGVDLGLRLTGVVSDPLQEHPLGLQH